MFQREPKAIGIAQDPWLTEIWILKRAHTCRQPVSVFTFLHSKAPNQRKKSWSCFHCNYNFIIQLTLHEKAEHQKKIFLLLTRTREKTDFTSAKRSYDFMFYLPLNISIFTNSDFWSIIIVVEKKKRFGSVPDNNASTLLIRAHLIHILKTYKYQIVIVLLFFFNLLDFQLVNRAKRTLWVWVYMNDDDAKGFNTNS